MRVGNTFKKREVTSENLSLKAKASVDPALREALTEDDGVFRPGALPKLSTSSANGNKLLLDSIDKARRDQVGLACTKK